MGGVTRRFPTLHFALLEGGMGWAFQQFAEIISLWEKRRLAGLEATNPASLDRKGYTRLVERYAGRWIQGRVAEFEKSLENFHTVSVPEAELDEWAAMEIERPEDFVDRYTARLFFGCEADDRANTLAFSPKLSRFGVRFNAVFGSDIGHFDVADMRQVLAEAHELRDEELIDAEDFRDFTFANAVRLHGGMNPKFFEGTAVASDAARVLAAT